MEEWIEAKKVLQQKYEGGMNCVEGHQKEIKETAESLGLTEDKVKNFIHNHKRKILGKSTKGKAKCLGRSFRKPDGHHLLVKETVLDSKLTGIQRFHEWSRQWHLLSAELRDSFKARAMAKHPSVTADDLIHSIQQASEQLELMGHKTYTLTQKDGQVLMAIGPVGKAYLRLHYDVTQNFENFCGGDHTPLANNEVTQHLRERVHIEMNQKYASLLGKKLVKFPYQDASSGLVEGWPEGVPLKHPSYLGKGSLTQVIKALPKMTILCCEGPHPNGTGKRKRKLETPAITGQAVPEELDAPGTTEEPGPSTSEGCDQNSN